MLELTVPEVELWWPLGYGAQTRYDVTVEVADQSFAAAVGFRTAELSTTPDAYGTGFSLVVNGTPIYVKGFNWIPDDALLTRLTPDTYRSSITEAVDAGANLLRIWGGGIYESDDFYDVCDELGILVWQDFLFACAAYSEDEPLRSEVVGRGARGRHPARVPAQPGGLERQQREHLGLRRVGLAPAAGRSQLGQRLLHRAAAGHRGRAGPADPVLPRQPVLLRRLPPPERPAQRHHAHLGRLEPARLHPLPRLPGPLRVRVRLPGPGRLVDAVLRRP